MLRAKVDKIEIYIFERKHMINELKNLNGLHRGNRRGLYKRWVLKDKSNYSRICDYLQKISYCIQDLNNELKLEKLTMKDVIFAIVQVVWIQEATEALETYYKDDIINKFAFMKSDELVKAKKYINAIRSFVIAHPLSTNRHEKYGFDGNYICIDVRTPSQDITFPLINDINRFNHLDFEGIHDSIKNSLDDFFLYCYSKKDDNMRFFQYIGCSMSDIYHVAELYIEKIYLFDKYLYNQKKSDYGVL